MTENIKELELPLVLIKQSPGFAIDIGGSAAKVIIRPKSLYQNGNPIQEEEGDMGKVWLKIMDKSNIEDVIRYIRENCDYNSEETITTYTAGFGANFYKTQLEQGLNVKTENISEFIAFSQAATALYTHAPKDRLFLLPSKESINLGQTRAAMEREENNGFGSRPIASVAKPALAMRKCGAFPFLLIMCGSGFLFLKVYSDGTFEICEMDVVGGRMFLGMAAAMTGCQDYDKLMNMINTHDGSTADIMGKDLVDENAGCQDMYNMVPKDMPVFPFGKVWNSKPEAVRPGDLAFSLLRTFSYSLGLSAYRVARDLELDKVFFCGNFVNNPRVKEWVTEEIAARDFHNPKNERLDVRFFQDGGYLGAIGCFLWGAV